MVPRREEKSTVNPLNQAIDVKAVPCFRVLLLVMAVPFCAEWRNGQLAILKSSVGGNNEKCGFQMQKKPVPTSFFMQDKTNFML